MVQPTEQPGVPLARRLRALRCEQWPERTVTQGQLAKALGGVSVALVSSWEKLSRPTPPPQHHLATYARLFATERSIDGSSLRPLELDELTPSERVQHDELLDELTRLRGTARTGRAAPTASEHDDRKLWHFPYDQDVTIVCAPLPPNMLAGVPFTDPGNPDYLRMARFADLDTLIELYGHIRALNPDNTVKCRTSDELRPDDFTSHLVLIGGVDWNTATRDMFLRVEIPVSQRDRPGDDDFGAFVVHDEGGEEVLFEPQVEQFGTTKTLVEDVAHFYRGPNPYNSKRTVTFLNGMFGRGTFGAARALTDPRFRDRNEAYVRGRFDGSGPFSVLSRVPVVNGRVVTPDWTIPHNRLHEWPEDKIETGPGGP